MTTPVERPRGVFEIFQESFSIYSKAFINFWIPFLIFGVISGAITAVFTIFNYHLIEDLTTSSTTNIGVYLLSLFISILLLIGFGLISNAIATGMIVTMVEPVASNKPSPTLSDAFQRVQRVLIRLILASILFSFIVAIGFILLIIPGLIFLTWYYLISVCIVLEDESTTGSFSRSKLLVSGYGWHTFGLIIVSFIGIFILSMILGIFVGIIIPLDIIYVGSNGGSYILGQILTTVANSIITPLGGIITVLLYFDLKARQEQPSKSAPFDSPSTMSPSPSAVYCSNCGAALPTDPIAVHCTECGTKFR